MNVQVKERRLPQARDRPGTAAGRTRKRGTLTVLQGSAGRAAVNRSGETGRQRGRVGAQLRSADAGGPQNPRSLVWFTDAGGFSDLSCKGYTSLAQSPEVVTAVNTIARLVGSMTVYLMKNLPDGGDVRVLNATSRLVDIEPNRWMNRSNFIQWIVRTLYLEGRGNAVVWPRTENGSLRELTPVPPQYAAFIPVGIWDGYRIAVNGAEFEPESLLHFVLNPGSYYPWLGDGYTLSLTDVANTLKQAATTEKGFMSSKWKPSLIVKVDALAAEFSTKAGRQKLLEDYVEGAEAGQPWLIPAESFDVKDVKPLSLSDLALADFVELDKKTVAKILGVPAFVLGVGEFHRDEWNSFVSTTVMPLCQIIEQELTRKLLPDPDLHFKFNARSLYNYDLKDLAGVADDQYVRGIMTGNEVRDWLGLDPIDGLDELIILENYIPRGMIADQSKLQGGNT